MVLVAVATGGSDLPAVLAPPRRLASILEEARAALVTNQIHPVSPTDQCWKVMPRCGSGIFDREKIFPTRRRDPDMSSLPVGHHPPWADTNGQLRSVRDCRRPPYALGGIDPSALG